MKILLAICILIFPLFSFSQIEKKSFEFNIISSINGLSGNDVNYITQDSIGYLWFSTGAGLDRYNGRTFKHFPKNLRSSFDAFFYDQKLYVDKDEQLWIIDSDNALEKFNYQTETFNEIKNIKNPKCIIQDSEGNWFIGTVGNGIYKIDKATSDTLKISGIEHDGVQFHFFTESKNKIYASSYHKIFEIENDRLRSIEHDLNEETVYTAISSNKRHAIWIGTENKGLYQFDESTQSFSKFMGFQPEHDFPGNLHISFLLFDKEDRLWVGTYGAGVYLIDFTTQSIEHFENDKLNEASLSHSGAKSIFIDKHERVWISTPEGANYYDKYLNNFEKFTGKDLPEGQDISIVRSIDMDKKGNIWVASLLSGILKIDIKDRTARTYTEQNSDLETNINYYSKVIDDQIWILHFLKDIQILNPPDTFENLNLNPEEKYFSYGKQIFEDSRGIIWILTTDENFLKFDRKKNALKSISFEAEEANTFPSFNIYSIAEDADYHLWLGTYGDGLIHYNIETEEYSYFKNIFQGNVITDIHPESDGTLYITGDKDGLLHFDPATGIQKLYNTSNGFATNNLYGILPHEDELWISSARGLIRFNKETKNIKNFYLSDGLQGLEFNAKARYKDPESGYLFFGGENGINWFHPDKIKTNPYPPETVITDIHLFEDPFAPEDNIEFKHDQNTFTFFFDGLHYSLPEKNLYRYRIKNYDNEWIDGKSGNSVRYTNLPSGDYEFQILAANYDGIWDESPATYRFSILKPWYGTNLAWIFYLIIFLVGIYGVYNYLKTRWYLKNQLIEEHNETERLKELDELKNRLYTNVSHEFRTPLALISGPVERQLRNPGIKSHQEKDLKLIKRNADRLLNLVDQLLDLSKLETGNLKIRIQRENLKPLLNQIISMFDFQAKEKKITFESSISVVDHVWIDRDILEKILTNLLSNAIKYTPKNGWINLDVYTNQDSLIINIINNGVQLKKEDLPKLFELFYKSQDESQGSGIGLSLVKELCFLSQGNIIANLLNKDEIQFTATLPIDKKTYPQSSIVFNEKKKNIINAKSLSLEKDIKVDSKDHPVLLIVEDDREIRDFVKSIFQENFKVKMAKNGRYGLQNGQEIIPDIIISDVMMPEMDGVSMTKKLKANELTSHIPIILLTAKAGRLHEIDGLESGADDYISKPFSEDALKLKVRNLYALKKKLQQRYSSGFMIKEMPCTNLNEEFLKKLYAQFEKHISDSDLTSTKLATYMGVSRTQLHRKLSALMGKSTTQFIRVQRCNVAKKLIENSNLNISEIAYKVGFNSASYFMRCFKKEFGVAPSSFRTQKPY